MNSQIDRSFARWFVPLAVVSMAVVATPCVLAAERPRLAVLTDIGGDPDDQQSLVRLLVYSNEFEIDVVLGSAC